MDATDDAAIATGGNGSKVYDPFAPPYNINLHVGDLKDEESQEEFVVLVRKVVRLKRFTDYFFDIQLNKFSVIPQHFLLVTKG